MKLKLLALAALAATSIGAQASTVAVLGSSPAFVIAGFIDATPAGFSVDSNSFTINAGSWLTTGSVTTQLSLVSDIDFANVWITDGVTTYAFTQSVFDSAAEQWVLNTTIGAGTYTLHVDGTIAAGEVTTFGGELHVTTVPEPETYALMLAGLGAVGFIARRRRSV
jgi:hypothetical protein